MNNLEKILNIISENPSIAVALGGLILCGYALYIIHQLIKKRY